jgi:hypothetical protein
MGKEEGVMGYFKGNGTNVVRMFPYSAVQFAAFEQFKKVYFHFVGVHLRILTLSSTTNIKPSESITIFSFLLHRGAQI